MKKSRIKLKGLIAIFNHVFVKLQLTIAESPITTTTRNSQNRSNFFFPTEKKNYGYKQSIGKWYKKMRLEAACMEFGKQRRTRCLEWRKIEQGDYPVCELPWTNLWRCKAWPIQFSRTPLTPSRAPSSSRRSRRGRKST